MDAASGASADVGRRGQARRAAAGAVLAAVEVQVVHAVGLDLQLAAAGVADGAGHRIAHEVCRQGAAFQLVLHGVTSLVVVNRSCRCCFRNSFLPASYH